MCMCVLKEGTGLIDEGETPEEAAIRELEEETGFKASPPVEYESGPEDD